MVSLAGLSAAYPGYQTARQADNQIDAGELANQNTRTQQEGLAALDNAYKAFVQSQIPGAQPMGAPQAPPMPQAATPQPPMPGQPSQPMQQGPLPNGGNLGQALPPPPPSFNSRFAAAGVGSGLPQGVQPPQPQAAPAPGQPPAAMASLPGGAGGIEALRGKLDVQTLIGAIVKANPNAKPGVIAAAVNQGLPLLTAQAQMDWKQMSLAIAAQRADNQARNTDSLVSSREKREDRMAQPKQSLNPNMLALQQFNSDFQEQNGRPPSAIEQADFLRKVRQPQGQINKENEVASAKANVLDQVDSAISQLEAQRKGGPGVTGVEGFVRRNGGEFVGNTLGISKGTPGSDFETKISLIKNELPRLIAGTSRISKDERDNLNKIVRGLDPRTSPEQAISSLRYVQKVLRGAVGADNEAASAPTVRSQNGQPQGKPLTDDVRQKAMDAIRRNGWTPAQVKQQLQNFGYDTTGF